MNGLTKIQMVISEEGISIQAKHKTGAPRGKPHDKPIDAAFVDAYMIASKFDRYECKVQTATIEVNSKLLDNRVKGFKRKERMIIYIENKKPYETLFIVGRSTTSTKDIDEITSGSVGITYYDRALIGYPIDDIEYTTIPTTGNGPNGSTGDPNGPTGDGDEATERVPVYTKKVTVPQPTYERMKKLGNKGQFKIIIQGSDYVKFTVANKNMYSNQVELGRLIEGEDVFSEEFNVDIFTIIAVLAKIKTPLMFYAPRYPQYPLKVVVALDILGEANVYIRCNRQLKALEETPTD